jgi:PilZ domain
MKRAPSSREACRRLTMDASQERKFRRFNFEYLARVKFPSGDVTTEAGAVVRNISLGVLFLEAACSIPCGTPVEFIIAVGGGLISPPVKLTGAGEVVRVDPKETPDKFGSALAFSQPIAQMEYVLAAKD